MSRHMWAKVDCSPAGKCRQVRNAASSEVEGLLKAEEMRTGFCCRPECRPRPGAIDTLEAVPFQECRWRLAVADIPGGYRSPYAFPRPSAALPPRSTLRFAPGGTSRPGYNPLSPTCAETSPWPSRITAMSPLLPFLLCLPLAPAAEGEPAKAPPAAHRHVMIYHKP